VAGRVPAPGRTGGVGPIRLRTPPGEAEGRTTQTTEAAAHQAAASVIQRVWETRSREQQLGYCTAFIISKIGRYIAITIPPTITPRQTIIAGSIRLSSELTATSTSSS
jgi:hypothetical protein